MSNNGSKSQATRKQFCVSLPDDVRVRLERMALAEGNSVAAVIRRLLMRALNPPQGPAAPAPA